MQNDSATMKIQRFSWAVEVPHAVRPTRPLERMQAEPSRDHRQALLHVLTISPLQERWNSKDVSLIAKRCSQEALTNNEVTNFINDLQKMGPDEDRTRDLVDKDFVIVWFKSETKLATMIGSGCWR